MSISPWRYTIYLCTCTLYVNVTKWTYYGNNILNYAIFEDDAWFVATVIGSLSFVHVCNYRQFSVTRIHCILSLHVCVFHIKTFAISIHHFNDFIQWAVTHNVHVNNNLYYNAMNFSCCAKFATQYALRKLTLSILVLVFRK